MLIETRIELYTFYGHQKYLVIDFRENFKNTKTNF